MMQVGVKKLNTDEPPVEASIVGKMLSEGTSYKGVPKSIAAVNRSWLCGNRSKGGKIFPQALRCNRGEPIAAGKKTIKVVSPSRRLLMQQRAVRPVHSNGDVHRKMKTAKGLAVMKIV